MRARKRIQQRHHSVKGRIVGLLSGVLTFGMAAGLYPGGGTETVLNAQAAEAISEPSVTDYATKKQLMDDTFKPDDGTGIGTNIGKLIFGKNSDGTAQKWYILGQDGIVSNNTLIFADRPIAKEVQFYSSTENRLEYGSTIYPNNYLHSDLDKKLQELEKSCFSNQELALMKDTEIKVKTDKGLESSSRRLYALDADLAQRSGRIYAGRQSSTRISIATYCSNADTSKFWLRSITNETTEPNVYQNVQFVNVADKKVGGAKTVTEKLDVWPAVDLNMSNILFASSYDGSNVSNQNGLILRLDGKNKDIGTVIYNRRTNAVTVKCGGTNATVRLVVQYGKTANEREIFTSVIGTSTGEKTWTSSEIFGNVNISEDDWSKCKIWLETKEDGMFYAVEATEDTTLTTIDSIIAKVDEPEGRETLSTSVITGENVTAEITWTDPNGLQVAADAKADYYPAKYTAHITFTPAKGYMFSDSTKIQINGLECESNLVDDKITAERYFYSSWDKLISITAPDPITADNGTSYADMNLPTQVDIVTDGGTVDKADVSWNTESPVSGSYDPAVSAEQTVTLQGTVTRPETINANGVELTTNITVTINAADGADTVEAPVIISQPQDVTVKAGETATFTVEATGTDLTYQWQKNDGKGFKDWGGINGKKASFTTGVLSKGCDGFQYQCIVSNSAGSVTSRSATLTVADDTTPPSETTYIITATAGANGSISPSGSVEVKEGADQTFTITADEGYEIENLKVDGSDVSAASSYTFNNVTETHSIEATFKQKVTNPDPGQPENPDPGKPEDPNPAEKPKPEVKKDETPASSQAPLHEHSFNWVTVQTASAMQDGLEELRCSCGIVKECSVVPASQAYVNELYQNLSQALAEGEVSFDSGRIYTISDYLIRKLQERADVTTTITFEYNQDKYRMMIPAGVDYSELLEDEDYFYGYFYFAKKVGARVESL